ncbi:hypothetical protein BKA63DRAFT_495583 [Paraphoma chrysanthemicola]|nr:hypothetical protein BKA63DRAFT_495583 [Paraphoma chrysanthemicola]
MQLKAIFTALTLTSCVVANLHFYAWCSNRVFKGLQEEEEANSKATEDACARYRNRNTGNNQWDKCPDCTPGVRGDVRVCNSPAKHIGGDEWDYYCKQVGADYGSAS